MIKLYTGLLSEINMKEFVFVEFLFALDEFPEEFEKLVSLGDDFQSLKCENEYEYDDDGPGIDYMRVSGRINAMTASLIKLKNPTLAGKMRISYISDELKDKYRT